MILVRNVFRLKFGQAQPAMELWKEALEIMKRAGVQGSPRVLTDLVGPFYTLVFENTYENLAAFERDAKLITGGEEWKDFYQKFVPLVDSGHREILRVVG